VKLEADEAESLASFGAYDVTEIVAPTQDAPACADGFPGMKEKAIPPTTLSADVARLVGISIQLSEPSHPGWSGSALTDANGLIGIVHGDLGTKTNLVAGLALRLELLRHDLFR
jgi:hypothetical protein